ncbi:MAG: aminotransferase class I/II-fold pyridoxal phosphate-dependent enzyme [Spirochaetaceae bacterium]|jgi:aspartate/methionine/tyrosine aminotransferase|nr:aminotransferase class I/II-fold pyridoxal phosphate-dependent enzyme [Spirochaetaceae bacterium]
MNCLAHELNGLLDGSVAGRLLSGLGRRLYFPKGIIAQSGEAKKSAYRANATIGMAYREGKPLILKAAADIMPGLKPEEIVVYAPTAGIEKARTVWKDLLIRKNPSINPEQISLPAVVPGLTAGISYTADLFLDEGTVLIASKPSWDNYELIAQERRGGTLRETLFLDSGEGLDMEAIGKAVKEEAETGAVRIIFNFPNNPSGYTPTRGEADALIRLIRETAEGGADVLAICDDAYFGFFYEENIIRESLFGALAGLHQRVLAVKIDGPTKEDYAWGLRMGFVTFGSKGLNAAQYEALVTKLMGAIRSSVSCANTPAQYLMLKTLEDPQTQTEKKAYYDLMLKRYQAVKRFIAENPPHPNLRPLPFNSGYFMTFRCIGVSAEALRKELLTKQGIGTISFGDGYLRAAFSSVEEAQIPQIYRGIYDAASVLAKG